MNEYTVHKINPDIHFICALNVIAKLYRETCGLCEGASRFFPSSSSCSLLNIWTNDREQIERNVLIANKKMQKIKA